MSNNPQAPTVGLPVGLAEQAIQNVCAILAPVLGSMVDEQANPLSVPVRAQYPDDVTVYPRITVMVQLGAVEFFGNGLVAVDYVNGVGQYTDEAKGSRVLLEIQAISEAQRQYLASYLRMAIRQGFTIRPDGTVLESIVMRQFDDAGLIPTGFAADQFPPPRLADARPEGQIYRATVTLLADIACAWTTPLQVSRPVQLVVTPNVGDGVTVVPPDPAITITGS